MRSQDPDVGDGSQRRPRLNVAGPSLVVTLTVAIGIAGCGGSTPKHAANHTVAPSAVTAAPVVSTPTLTTYTPPASSAKPAKPAHAATARRKGHRTGALFGTPTKTTIAPTSPTRPRLASVSHAPKYTGPSPTYCLKAAGLNRARQATASSHVWQANFGNSLLHDGNAIVFLSGPFESIKAAQSFAQPMLASEFAATGGPWVASAARSSGLGRQVDNVARCMASVA